MDQPLKKVSCDPVCGFEVQSHDEKELVGIVVKHAKHAHDKTLSESEAEDMMVAVSA